MGLIGDEAEVFIRRSKVALVATLSPKARPFMTPLWFVLHGGALYFMTGTQSWAGRNVARHPDVTLLFGSERGVASERFLRLHARGTRESGLPPWQVLARVVAKYYLAPRALLSELKHVTLWRRRLRYYRQTVGGAGYLRVVPTSAEFLPQP